MLRIMATNRRTRYTNSHHIFETKTPREITYLMAPHEFISIQPKRLWSKRAALFA